MHIAINAYFWNQTHTGSGQYTRQLVYHLNRLVSDVDITLVYPQSDELPQLHDVPPSVKITAVSARPGHWGKLLFEQVQFPRACRHLGVDLAHIPYWGGPLSSPVPQVVTIHDLTTLLVPEYRRGLKARLYNALVRASARGASHIITDSFSSKLDIMDHLHLDEQAITAIYLAAGPQYSQQENSLVDMAILRKYDLPDFYILYLGGYVLHKNIMNLLQAYTYVAQALGEDYPLVLAGHQPTEITDLFPDYEGYIKRVGLEKYIRWIGFVDEEDKPTLYRNAETFVFPSRYEGFGLPVLEAMACGTPVVTSNTSSLPEVIGPAGFANDPDDYREMAGSIIASVIQENLRAELRQKGLEQARKFSWENTAAQTALVYAQALEQK